MDHKLDQTYVRSIFKYHKDGYLIRTKRTTNRVHVGDIAGTLDQTGYYNVRVLGKVCKLHRVIFLYHHGYFPENVIDHIDRNPLNNRIENLREVSISCNMHNASIRCDNKYTVTGVYWHKRDKYWFARITDNGKRKIVSPFSEFKDAVLARYNLELAYNPCLTKSTAYTYLKDNNLLGEIK